VVLRHGCKVCDYPVAGDLHEFHERVVAYIVGARNDFPEAAVEPGQTITPAGEQP